MLSAALTTRRRAVGRLVNKELETIHKEAVVALFEIVDGLRKPMAI
jgi:hypothetical protein